MANDSFSIVSSLIGDSGGSGVEATTGPTTTAKKSPSSLLSLLKSNDPKQMKLAKEAAALSVADSVIQGAAGILDVDSQARASSRAQQSAFDSSVKMLEDTSAFRSGESALNFAQTQELREQGFEQAMSLEEQKFAMQKGIEELKFSTSMEMQERRFDLTMDVLAAQTGLQKDQLKNNVQFSDTVRQVNNLDTLLNIAREQQNQPSDPNTQQFFN
jgi:hypothetical protein